MAASMFRPANTQQRSATSDTGVDPDPCPDSRSDRCLAHVGTGRRVTETLVDALIAFLPVFLLVLIVGIVMQWSRAERKPKTPPVSAAAMSGTLEKQPDPSDFFWLEAERSWCCELRLRTLLVVSAGQQSSTPADPHVSILVAGSPSGLSGEHLSGVLEVLRHLPEHLHNIERYLFEHEVEIEIEDRVGPTRFRHSTPLILDVLSIEACRLDAASRTLIVVATGEPDHWVEYEAVLEDGKMLSVRGLYS